MATFIGSDGNDTFNGTSGNDSAYGGLGADVLKGSYGADYLDGGAGNDSLTADSDVIGDTLLGGTGNDLLTGRQTAYLDGGDGADYLSATDLSTILGAGGNDRLYANDGDFVLMDGGEGDDDLRISGNVTYCTIIGGAGDDTIHLNGSNHVVDAGAGQDQIDFIYAGAGSTVTTGTEADLVTISLWSTGLIITDFNIAAGGDRLDLSDVLASLCVDHGYDFSNPFAGNWMRLEQSGADALLQVSLSGTGSNWITLVSLLGVSTADLNPEMHFGLPLRELAVSITGSSANETIDEFNPVAGLMPGLLDDSITGEDGDDLLSGGLGGNDLLAGGSGSDSLFGFSGDDTLYGDAADTLVPGAGDYINGGTGNDLIFGGDGDDSRHVSWYRDVGYSNSGLQGGDGDDTVYGGNGNDSLFGGNGDDVLFGDDGNDAIHADSGADFMDGGDGNDTINYSVIGIPNVAASDTLLGGNGNDIIRGDDGADSLDGGADDDYLIDYGASGLDSLSGGTGNDTLMGGSNDSIDGGEGNDLINVSGSLSTIAGGDDDDVIVVDGIDHTIDAGAGNDLIDFQLADGSSLLTTGVGSDRVMLAIGATPLIISDFDNSIGGDQLDLGYVLSKLHTSYGFEIANPFTTGWMRVHASGSDTLVQVSFQGSSSNWVTLAQLVGVNAADLDFETHLMMGGGAVSISGSNASEVIDELNPLGGLTPGLYNDTVSGGPGHDLISGGLEGDDLLIGGGGLDSLFGFAGNDTMYGDAVNPLAVGSADLISGGAGNDLIYGGGGNDGANAMTYRGLAYSSGLNGDSGNDTVYGGDGNDEVRGGTGNDSLFGDTGNDTVYGGGGADHVDGGDGDDVIETWTFDDGAMDTLLGGTGNDSIVGMSGDYLDGGIGNDQVHAGSNSTALGGDGNDTMTGGGGTLIDGGSGSDNLSALSVNASATLLGGTGHDTLTGGISTGCLLDGGAGDDRMTGGYSNDTYVVDSLADVIVEPEGGIDTVQAGLSWTLGTNLENISLTGIADINATGNALDNRLSGNIGANILTGGNGNDTLNGGSGDDSFVGGFGNDTYVVNSLGDVIIELADAGSDSLRINRNWTLGSNLENLTLTGTENINGTGDGLNNVLRGNAGTNLLSGADGNDTLYGSAGNDTLAGGRGDDRYFVDVTINVIVEVADEGVDALYTRTGGVLGENVENIFLIGVADVDGAGNALANFLRGNLGDNSLSGGEGNDTLFGGYGADFLAGGFGDDTYIVNAEYDLDGLLTVNDLIAEDISEGTDTLKIFASWTLGDNVENLVLTGSEYVDGTGNELNNLLRGNGGANSLSGGDGNDTLHGQNGDDTLVGGSGDDEMNGGAGRDVYVVDSQNDVILEFGADYWGPDLVISSIGWTLGAHLEDLTLTGGDDIGGAGNNLDNFIAGNAGDNILVGGAGYDRLAGGAGADTLFGGAGSDSFVFNAPLDGTTNVDFIADFSEFEGIALDHTVFAAVPGDWTGFVKGTHATTVDQILIYDSATGSLYYDADGSGVGEQIQFAAFVVGAPVEAWCFWVT